MKLFEITLDKLSVDEVVARLADPANGAVVTFIGVVRNATDGRAVHHLEYEAYPEMAEGMLRQIGDEIRARWTTIREVTIVHRMGKLPVGETAVVIALSAAHRPEMFCSQSFCERHNFLCSKIAARNALPLHALPATTCQLCTNAV